MHLSTKFILSVDAMGGENAPASVVEGIGIASKKYTNLFFLLFGDKEKIEPMLRKQGLQKKCQVIHTKDVIPDDQPPTVAFRKGKNSSMRLAINSLEQKEADACISSGNTGALMVTAKMVLGTIKGIERPAITGTFPGNGISSVMLDIGANTDCKPSHFLQFALMGHCFCKAIFATKDPKIALLNVGKEDIKGRDLERDTYKNLKKSSLNFIGNIEANEVFKSKADVIVTDGFSGNIFLKATEGAADFIKSIVKGAFKQNFFSKIGWLLSRKSFHSEFQKFDHRNYNGAMFVGLDGVVVKSHGNADKIAFANAIGVTYSLLVKDINAQITHAIELEDKKEGVIGKIKRKLGI